MAIFRIGLSRIAALASYTCCCLILSCTPIIICPVFAQTRQSAATAASIENQPGARLLDTSGGYLPPKFVGWNANSLYKTAVRLTRASAKGEFETTAHYKERLAALTEKPLIGKIKASDTFAFALRPAVNSISGTISKRDDFLSLGFIQTDYDADAKIMTVTIPTKDGPAGGNEDWTSCWHRSIVYGTPFWGQNGFGARRLLRRVTRTDVDLAIEDSQWLSQGGQNSNSDSMPPASLAAFEDSLEISFSIEPEEARILSRNIEVVLVGSLKMPFTYHDLDGVDATFDHPLDRTFAYKLLYVHLDQLIIADRRTGEVYADFSRE